MNCKIIEATNGFNWGKFALLRFDREWTTRSEIDGSNLLHGRGWTGSHVFVMDLQTGEGGMFGPWGYSTADLTKHCIWVCPMFEPFLEWLYKQHPFELENLPPLVNLDPDETAIHSALWGFRRPGSEIFEQGSGI